MEQQRKRGRPAGVMAKGMRVKAWRAMRIIRDKQPTFTLGDLLDIIATGQEKNAHSNLLKYMACLERHGIVGRSQKNDFSTNKMGPGLVVWHLERDLGWLAPVWRQSQKVLWNPNANCVVEPVEVQK